MEWIIIIAIFVFGIAIFASRQSNKKVEIEKRSFDEYEKAGISLQESDPDSPEMDELISDVVDIGVNALTAIELTREERADVINEVIESLDENVPEKSEILQVDMIRLAYDKLYQRYSMTKDLDATNFIIGKLKYLHSKTEVTNADYADMIEFVESKKPVKEFVQVIYSSDDENGKKELFAKYLEEYKDHSIEELEQLIETNKKEDYNDYTLDDKQKWRAMKTIIEEKSK